MKRKLLLMLMLCALTTLVACGKEEEKETVELGSIIIEEETISTEIISEDTQETETDELVTDSEETTTENNVITTVKEEDAVIDFNGVKIPVTITWEEFKTVMTENNWTFKDSEDNFPGKRLSGGGYVYTNCGPVYFSFNKNEDKTKSVLMRVVYYNFEVTGSISISGISYNTSKELLDAYITPIENKYYLDEYLSAEINEKEGNFIIERTHFNLR